MKLLPGHEISFSLLAIAGFDSDTESVSIAAVNSRRALSQLFALNGFNNYEQQEEKIWLRIGFYIPSYLAIDNTVTQNQGKSIKEGFIKKLPLYNHAGNDP